MNDVGITPKAASAAVAPRPGRAWLIVGMLFMFFFINFADKLVVSLAGDALMKSMNITPSEFGIAQSSFFWCFAIGSVLGGQLIGRINARYLLVATVGIWVISLLPMVWSDSFAVLIGSRMLLGLAEGPAVAMVVATAHTWFTADRRATPTSVMMSGTAFGPLIAAPVLTVVIHNYTWHHAFLVLAVLGACWIPLWLIFGGTGPVRDTLDEPTGESRPGLIRAIKEFRKPSVAGLSVLTVALYFGNAAVITFLPLFLTHALGYTSKQAGKMLSLPFAAIAIEVVLIGVVSRAMTRRGKSAFASRQGLPLALALVSAVSSIAFALAPRGPLSLLLMAVFVSAGPACIGVILSAVSDVVPTVLRGGVLGVFAALYSIGGAIAPLLVGMILGDESTASGYRSAFLIIGIAVVIGDLIAATLLLRGRRAAAATQHPAAVPTH